MEVSNLVTLIASVSSITVAVISHVIKHVFAQNVDKKQRIIKIMINKKEIEVKGYTEEEIIKIIEKLNTNHIDDKMM